MKDKEVRFEEIEVSQNLSEGRGFGVKKKYEPPCMWSAGVNDIVSC
jgi:hypothetical protein